MAFDYLTPVLLLASLPAVLVCISIAAVVSLLSAPVVIFCFGLSVIFERLQPMLKYRQINKQDLVLASALPHRQDYDMASTSGHENDCDIALLASIANSEVGLLALAEEALASCSRSQTSIYELSPAESASNCGGGERFDPPCPEKSDAARSLYFMKKAMHV